MKPHLERRAAEMRRRFTGHAQREREPERRDPETPAEWQEAVDGAEFFLAIDSCRQYGLITGGPGVNAERCVEILRRGRERGVSPAPLKELVRRYNA